MHPLTVIHTEASNGWGGQEIRILSECRWFRDQGHRVILVNPPDGRLFRNAADDGFDVVPMALTKRSQWADVLRLRQLFGNLRPDVVATHSSTDSRAALIAATLARVPCRLRYRHISAPIRPNPITAFQYRHLCDHVITTGLCIADPIVQRLRVPRERVDVVPTGIRIPGSLPDRDAARVALANELRLPRESRFIGSVAVLRSWKGHEHVVAAFEQLAHDFPNVHCVFFGDGPIRPFLEERIRNSTVAHRIHLPGHRSDVWPAFRALDVAILASTRNEGIPQSALQSFIAETPFVGTRVGGIPEVVHNLDTGLLVNPESPDAIASATRRLLTDSELVRTLTRSARATALQRHSIDAMGEQLTLIIRTILTAKRGGSRRETSPPEPIST